jgi:hypothetical protein
MGSKNARIESHGQVKGGGQKVSTTRGRILQSFCTASARFLPVASKLLVGCAAARRQAQYIGFQD